MRRRGVGVSAAERIDEAVTSGLLPAEPCDLRGAEKNVDARLDLFVDIFATGKFIKRPKKQNLKDTCS